MNTRSLWTIGLIGVVVPAVIGLIHQLEHKEPKPILSDASLKSEPPVSLLVFTPDARADNFRTLGLEGENLAVAVDQADALAKRGAELSRGLAAARQNDVHRFFCREKFPIVYRAAALVLSNSGERVDVINPLMQGRFGQKWEGYVDTEVGALFERWEVSPQRVDEDTAMALAALVSRRVPDAISQGRPPFNVLARDGGSLAAVEAAIPGVGTTLARYLATVHVLAEIVQADQAGFACDEELSERRDKVR